jgi:ligand-binding sensor domain-containing protein/signal transduction histidine kinase
MPSKCWILAAAWLPLFVCADGLPAAPNARYTVDVWGTEEGLPQNSVISMAQSRDGYLWLGTLGGLVRFDGIRFKVFNESNTPGLNSSRIVHLFEDSQGNLWIGTETAGAALVRNGKVISLDIGRGSREGRLMAACEDATGSVWLYTAAGQLCRYRKGNMDVWNVDTNPYSDRRCIIAENSGSVWLGRWNGMDWRVCAIDPNETFQPREFPTMQQELPAARLDYLLASQRGGYWRLSEGRVQKWQANRREHDWGPYPWKNDTPVAAACEDAQGNLVVGTLGEGVFLFDAMGRATCLSTNEGLSHNFILSVLVDREGTLWVGTDGGGLNRVKQQIFEVSAESRNSVVQSVCEDAGGGLWIGFNEINPNASGVGYWKNGVLQRFGPDQGVMNSSVSVVFVDRNQRVWVGTWGGLFQWGNGRFQQVDGPGMVQQGVQAIYQDRGGRLWLGTQGGLVRWDGQEWKVFTTRDGLSADAVRAMAEDREGNLWVGTSGGGLNRLRDGQFAAFTRTNGLPSDNVSSLYLDDAGILWVGTSGGLARFHDGKCAAFSTSERLPANSVGYLLEDGQGCLWIGSNAGLVRVPRKTLNDFANGLTNSLASRTYTKADGLPTRECSSGSQPAACRARDGTLWFPTIKGLAFANPAQFVPNTNPPPVVIESVRVDGREQTPGGLRAAVPQNVTVPAGKERLEIQFTSLNLSAPDQARLKYRLEGHETAWTEMQAPPGGEAPVARYPNLPPGHYRFQVTACNEDGVWNEAGAALAIVVEPPFWRTWWCLGATTVFLLAIIVAVVHYVSTQQLQRQLQQLRQQEAIERERSRIARDIHDQLGASLTQVALLGELVESDKDAPTEVEAHARQISQTARDTTRVLDEIVWTVNPSNDTLDGLVTYVCKYAQEYLAVAGLRYRLEVPTQLPTTVISPEIRHNVFLAAKEALTNIVRHAKASGVWLRLKLEPAAFALEIEDDGGGFAEPDGQAAQSRNGLRNMRKRMEDIGGSFAIGQALKRGTVVRLTVPMGHH